MGVTRSLLWSVLALGSAATLVAPRVPAAVDDTAAVMKQHAARSPSARRAGRSAAGGLWWPCDAGGWRRHSDRYARSCARCGTGARDPHPETGHTVKGVYLVIDNNPAPLAGHFTFGPRADPAVIKLRVRVNMYTYMHAVAEGVDGKLYVSQQFVKTSGGCSAPAGPDNTEALKDVGLMKLKLFGTFTPGKPLQAQLMIRHPNFNGMQMDQMTRTFTPARFIRPVGASYDGAQVFRLDSDISLSTDPVITFGFVPDKQGTMKLLVRDSDNALFNHSFDVPAGSGLISGGSPVGGSVILGRALCVGVALAFLAGARAGWRRCRSRKATGWGRRAGPVTKTLSGGTVIHAQRLAKLLKPGGVLVVDVSDAPKQPPSCPQAAVWLPVPHPVIPGAIWIPGAGLGGIDPGIERLLRERLAQGTGNDPEHPVVIYCHRSCWLSWNAAKRAIGYGYRRIYWYPDGMEGWRAAGFPTASAEPCCPD